MKQWQESMYFKIINGFLIVVITILIDGSGFSSTLCISFLSHNTNQNTEMWKRSKDTFNIRQYRNKHDKNFNKNKTFYYTHIHDLEPAKLIFSDVNNRLEKVSASHLSLTSFWTSTNYWSINCQHVWNKQHQEITCQILSVHPYLLFLPLSLSLTPLPHSPKQLKWIFFNMPPKYHIAEVCKDTCCAWGRSAVYPSLPCCKY